MYRTVISAAQDWYQPNHMLYIMHLYFDLLAVIVQHGLILRLFDDLLGGGQSVENLLGSVNTHNLVCMYIGSPHSHLGYIQMLYFISMPYIPHKNQGLVFLCPDSENIFQKMLPIGELAATLKSASDRRAFSEECCCFGIIIYAPFNSIQLY